MDATIKWMLQMRDAANELDDMIDGMCQIRWNDGNVPNKLNAQNDMDALNKKNDPKEVNHKMIWIPK